MNDRESISRSLLLRHAGWLSAGLCTLTALIYCSCGPTIGARAGSILPMGFSDGGDEDLPPNRVMVDEYVETEANQQVDRALFEEDPRASKPEQIQHVSLWPLVKKPNTPTANSSTAPRDPFAEAEQKAISAAVSRKAPAAATARDTAARGTAANTAASRRRLREYQAQSQSGGTTTATGAATVAVKPSPAVKAPASVKEVETSAASEQPAQRNLSPASAADFGSEKQLAATGTASAPLDAASEQQLRALFEGGAAESAKVPAKGVIQQVSEPDTASAKVAVPAEQQTEMPTEAMLYRTRQARQRNRRESSRVPRMTAQKATSQPANQGAVAAEVAAKPANDQAAGIEPKLAPSEAASPLPSPHAGPELAGKAQVDQEETAAERAAQRPPAAPSSPTEASKQPAFIGSATPSAVPTDGISSTGASSTAAEPVIRPAKAELPPVQVVANRPLELPPPPGWTAARAAEARRVARLAELVHGTPAHHSVRQVAPAALSLANHTPARVPQTSEFPGEPQSVTPQSHRSAVTLDTVEEPCKVLDSAGIVQSHLALTTEEPLPADVPVQYESSAVAVSGDIEPDIVPEYATYGQPTWLLYWVTAGGLMFGCYGLWSGWMRRST